MNICTIIGARPQFIKASALSRKLSQTDGVNEIIVHTGQHFDESMNKVFFDEMNIPTPDYNLNLGSLSHGEMTGRMIEEIEKILIDRKPEWVILYGDTNSTLAGAISASKLNVKIAHIEAGLRSFNMKMPEEINRIITDRLSTLLFYPSKSAFQNLQNEGITNWGGATCIYSGDIMFDSLNYFKNLSYSPKNLEVESNYILCTIHRAENTNDLKKLKNIVEALNSISETNTIVLPLHPRTKKIFTKNHIKLSDKIKVIDPVGYLSMCWLIKNCSFVITDSGGLQKEAYFLHKPCLTIREETEWVELIELGVNILCGSNKITILNSFEKIKTISKELFSKPLYGDGNSSDIVLDHILNF